MYPQKVKLAYSADDVVQIAGREKKAVVIGLENGYPIGTDITMIKAFYDLGVRYITLCHNGHNDICDSAMGTGKPLLADVDWNDSTLVMVKVLDWIENYTVNDVEPEHGGLSEFGKQVVAEMNRLGMIIDISHLGASSVADVLEVSNAPVIASHSSCRALCNSPRNLDDTQLKMLAEKGGCIQITAVGSFLKDPVETSSDARELLEELGLCEIGFEKLLALYKTDRPSYDKLYERFQPMWEELTGRFPPADISDFADHIDHAVKLIGINHVGIGSDFDGGGGVKGFNDASEAAHVTVELLRRGYTEEDIKKIWGGNLLRVWREMELVAVRLQKK